jgi:two-component system, LytTR family, sensor kinase
MIPQRVDALKNLVGPLVFGWLCYGLIYLNQNLLIYASINAQVRDPFGFTVRALVPPLVWVVYSVGIISLSEAQPLRGKGWWTRILIHLAAFVLIHTADVALDRYLGGMFGEPDRNPFWGTLARQLNVNLFLYALIAAVAHLRMQFFEARGRELRTAQLETDLVSAQLESLKMQIQPHFLFNTLNAISQLFHEDPHRAERMMSRLGDLLRMTMSHGARQLVPLREELDFVNGYLDIQRTRFPEQLNVSVDVPADVQAALVPPLLLQPLVENSIKHGILPAGRRGGVSVDAKRLERSLRLTVADNGVGFTNVGVRGMGLDNIEKRLQKLFGPRSQFTVSSTVGRGTLVTIDLPYLTESAP